MQLNLSKSDLDKIKKAFPSLPDVEKRKVAELLKVYQTQITQKLGKDSFLDFIQHVYPGYKVGPHHQRLAKIFEDIEAGRKKRVIVNIAPRHGKSEMISYLAPAWFLGKNPHKKVIMASHTADLAVNFGRRVRNLVGSESYRDIFPQVELQADSKSASRWGTNFNGEYFAIGVGGALAGRGADLFIIDDPHSEQDAKQGRADVFEPAWEWFQSGPVQRLMPGGSIIVVMTRWSKSDLTGKIVDHMTREDDADEWEVVEFPAILNDKPLWPEFWGIDELMGKKASMDVRYWQAQYMQQPTSEEGALIKREWWQVWEKEDPPHCEHIILSLDAAQEKTNRSDYNALLTWGVFFNEETKNYQEMRRMGVPISEFTPGKGQDKISRVNAVSDLFSSGIVWVPDRRWAWEVVEECNDFPSGTHDDLVDATTLALLRFRQGGFIRLPSDEPEPVKWFKGRRREAYY